MYQLSFIELHLWLRSFKGRATDAGYTSLADYLYYTSSVFTTEIDNLELTLKLSEEFQVVVCIQDSVYAFDDIYPVLEELHQKGLCYRQGVVEYLFDNEEYDMFQFEVGDGTDPWVVIRDKGFTTKSDFECRMGMVANTYKDGYYITTVTLPK